ncbi:hypothetical protein NDU88_002839 [Pleurodeles waltl]|uniref:Uncharacterized protein n=1 Tax=Pleurodeles waltl TaxID=8319 RepID=A0AAV7NIW1_PLEWA|nr:hypothetical protein NDU88_002839 [Pleurodeles waltl]
MQSSSSSYEEEEVFSLLPWADEIYKAADASIHKAVPEAIASKEHLYRQVLEKYARFQAALKPEPPLSKRKLPGADQDAFGHLKRAFRAKRQPSLGTAGSTDKLLELPSYSSPHIVGADYSQEDSDEEAGPWRTWCPLALDDAPKAPADVLDLDKIIHSRSAEWTPADKEAKYIASCLSKPLVKEERRHLCAECPPFWHSSSGTRKRE